MYVSPFGVSHPDIEISKGLADSVYGKDRLKSSDYRGQGFKHGAKKYSSAFKTVNNKQGTKDQLKMVGQTYGGGAAGIAAGAGAGAAGTAAAKKLGLKSAKGKVGMAAAIGGTVGGIAGTLGAGIPATKKYNNKVGNRVRADWKAKGL